MIGKNTPKFAANSGIKKIMEVKDQYGKAHPIYGDSFAHMAIEDALSKLAELEAERAAKKGHDA